MENRHKRKESYPFRMPAEVRTEAEKAAKANERSLNWQLTELVKMGLEQMRVKAGAQQ